MDRLELKFIRGRLGLTQAGLGAIICLRPLTIRRYEMPKDASNHRVISPNSERQIRMIVWIHDHPDFGPALIDEMIHDITLTEAAPWKPPD